MFRLVSVLSLWFYLLMIIQFSFYLMHYPICFSTFRSFLFVIFVSLCCCTVVVSFFVCFDFIFVKHSYNLHLSLSLFFYCVISFIFLHFVNGGENSYSLITFYVVISFYIYLFSNCFLFNSFSFSQLTSVF